eukprot:scaffold6653_cov71-Skeletonema_dohrnii-CCMP3373.AAC.3
MLVFYFVSARCVSLTMPTSGSGSGQKVFLEELPKFGFAIVEGLMSPRGESSGHLVRPVGPLALPTYAAAAVLQVHVILLVTRGLIP